MAVIFILAVIALLPLGCLHQKHVRTRGHNQRQLAPPAQVLHPAAHLSFRDSTPLVCMSVRLSQCSCMGTPVYSTCRDGSTSYTSLHFLARQLTLWLYIRYTPCMLSYLLEAASITRRYDVPEWDRRPLQQPQ